MIFDRGSVDIDLHWLSDGTDGTDGDLGENCTARHDRMLHADADAMGGRLVLDTYVTDSGEAAGPALFVVVACEEGDPNG